MIIDFSVRNYKAIKDEVTFSFEANPNISNLSDYYIIEPIPGVKLLKMALIYGANASGKSTVLSAIELLKRLMSETKDTKNRSIQYDRFKLSNETRNSDSSFNIHFIVKEICYYYEIRFNDKCVLEERLYTYHPLEETEDLILSRTTDIENQIVIVKVSPIYCNDKNIGQKFQDNMRWNETIFAGFQHVNAVFPTLRDINHWLENSFYPIIEPRTELYDYISKRIEEGEIDKNNVLTMLKRADFMIDNIYFKEDEKLRLDKDIAIRKILMELGRIEGNESEIKTKHVEFHHTSTTGEANLTYDEESLGTQRFYEFCGLLDVMANEPGVFTIDEIEQSLHPELLEFFIYAFLCNTSHSQILATTHNRELLINRDTLRSDTIWFTEKREDGSTDLYSLDDFNPEIFATANQAYYNAYKNGRLGAKPILGDYYFDLKHHDKK